MGYRITAPATDLLAQCLRSAFTGWAINCPATGQIAQRVQRQTTTISGFSFSRFANRLISEVGADYKPRNFPLSVMEVCALAHDLENLFATPVQIRAAALIVAHSPCAQPAVGTKGWRLYFDLMESTGVCAFGGDPDWSRSVRVDLAAFCLVVSRSAEVVHV